MFHEFVERGEGRQSHKEAVSIIHYFVKRDESRSGSNRGNPSALPLGQTADEFLPPFFLLHPPHPRLSHSLHVGPLLFFETDLANLLRRARARVYICVCVCARSRAMGRQHK